MSPSTTTNVHIRHDEAPPVTLYPPLERAHAFTQVHLGGTSLIIGGTPAEAAAWFRMVAEQIDAAAAVDEPIPFTVTDAGRAALAGEVVRDELAVICRQQTCVSKATHYWHDAGPFGAGTFYGCAEHAPDGAEAYSAAVSA